MQRLPFSSNGIFRMHFAGPLALAAESEYEITSYRAGVEADTDLGFLTISGFRNEVEVLYSFGLNETSLTAFAIEDLFKVGTRNTIRLSAEYRDGESNSFPAPGNGDFGYETLAASAMWNRKFSDSIELTLAGRYDHVDWSRDGDLDPARADPARVGAVLPLGRRARLPRRGQLPAGVHRGALHGVGRPLARLLPVHPRRVVPQALGRRPVLLRDQLPERPLHALHRRLLDLAARPRGAVAAVARRLCLHVAVTAD